jgi:parallel beta-helix repeat protein
VDLITRAMLPSAVIAVVALLSSVMAGSAETPTGPEAVSNHNLICIEGDSEFTWANGVVSGSGTPEDPYLISGWEIDSEYGYAIEITDTRMHFVISEVSLFSSIVGTYGVGVVLRNVTNGAVIDSSLRELFWGIQVINSQNITIGRCAFEEITQCAIYASSQSCLLSPTMNLTIRDCMIAGCRVVTDEGGTIINNGLELVSTQDVLVQNNSVAGAMRALQSWYCVNMTVYGNSLIENSEYGISLYDCSQADITDNEMVANGYGLRMSGSDNATVTWNLFLGTFHAGIEYSGCSGIQVHHNDFMGNYGSAYAHGDVDNTWDDGYPGGGNYWSDYAGIDEFSGPDQDLPGQDGIGDTPYSVTYMSGYYDRYPLMAPVTGPANVPPVAVIIVDPSEGTTSTTFTLDASESYDAEDPTDDLMVRWEIGGDGIWETDWTVDKTFTWVFTSVGRNYVRLQVRDTTLQLDDATIVIEVSEAPETSAIIAGDEGENGWFTSVVEVELEAECANGIEYTEYRVNGSDWALYSIPLAFSQEGVHTLEFYSEDSLGNVEEVQTVEVMIDYTAPTLNMVTENNTVFEMADVNISWLCADFCSGVDRVEYSLNGGPFTTCDNLSAAMLSGLVDGIHQLVVNAYDVAGNSVSDELSFEVALASGVSDGGDSDWMIVGAVAAIVAIVSAVAAIAFHRRHKRPPQD